MISQRARTEVELGGRMSLIRHRRIARCALIIAIAAVTVIAHDGIDAQAPKRLALVGGMLVTGYEVPPIHHAAVLVEGNKIVAAGPAAEVKIPADASVVDTSGRAVLPGLIETHGHLIVLGHGSYDTWFPWIKAHGGDAMLTRVMEISAKQLLMAGVTTTIDLGAPLQPILSMRDRISRGEASGTRLFVSGPWISRGAGGAMQDGFGGINISTPEEAAQQTEKLAVAGVDHIKAHAGLTLDDYKAIVGAAHKHRIRVFAHVYAERAVKQFIESGAVMGMGTDSGTPMNFHSEALWREIKVHVDMGMTATRAIAAATRVNAQIIGKGRELGSIEPGKIADIIVVNGNPLFDITALSHVAVVV